MIYAAVATHALLITKLSNLVTELRDQIDLNTEINYQASKPAPIGGVKFSGV